MYDKPNAQSSQLLLFADRPPNLNELCTITAKLNKQVLQQSSAVQPQILKCREIIFTEPTIIATPAYDVSNAFYVVMEQSLYKTGRLQSRFQKIGIEASKPMIVSPAMYQACLRYTLVARIAPNWNKTGEWLIQGRDFLTSNGYVNAVKLDITVNQGEMYFSLDATTVKFLPLHVEDLDIYGKCYKEFMQYHDAEINESAIGSPWSHVLPSMKKGKVVGVTRTLPQSGPFKSYKDLKRHWKNTYGYRLPESEDGVIYYQVHFRPLGGRIFTYPEVCLRASDIQRVPRVDPKPILTAFLQGVQSKMSTICGFPLRLQTKAKYPILELLPPDQQISKQANLSNRSSSGKILNRSKEEMAIMLNREQGASRSCQTSLQTDPNNSRDFQNQVSVLQKDNNAIFKSMTEPTSREATMVCVPQSRNNQQREVISATRDSAIELHDTQNTTRSDELTCITRENCSVTSTPTPGSRIIPSFTARKSNSQKTINTLGSSIMNNKKTVPVFKPKKMSSTVIPSSPFSSGTAPNEKDRQIQPQMRVTCLSEKKSFSENNGSFSSETAKVPSMVTSFKPKTLSANASRGNFVTGQLPQHLTPKHNPNPLSSSKGVACTSSSKPSVGVTCNGSATPSTPQTKSFQMSSTAMVHQMTPKGTPTVSKKRPKQQNEEGTPKIKKPRSKPQIQENLDVEILARANQLQKANASTLITWLKDKGISHKSKDKKSDLIDRVNTVLGLGMEP